MSDSDANRPGTVPLAGLLVVNIPPAGPTARDVDMAEHMNAARERLRAAGVDPEALQAAGLQARHADEVLSYAARLLMRDTRRAALLAEGEPTGPGSRTYAYRPGPCVCGDALASGDHRRKGNDWRERMGPHHDAECSKCTPF